MAIPLLLSGAIVVFARRHLQDASLLRGLWLIPIAVAGTVVSGAVHRMTDLDDALVNRSLSALVLAGCILFVVVNRHTVTGLVRLGVLMTTIGAGLNALATLAYGFMPVLQSAARYLGVDLATGSHPTSRYVTAHGSQTFAVLLGDAIPIRGLNAIISIGDVSSSPGAASCSPPASRRCSSRTTTPRRPPRDRATGHSDRTAPTPRPPAPSGRAGPGSHPVTSGP